MIWNVDGPMLGIYQFSKEILIQWMVDLQSDFLKRLDFAKDKDGNPWTGNLTVRMKWKVHTCCNLLSFFNFSISSSYSLIIRFCSINLSFVHELTPVKSSSAETVRLRMRTYTKQEPQEDTIIFIINTRSFVINIYINESYKTYILFS